MHSPVQYSWSILECQSQTGLNSEYLICIWKIQLNYNHCNLHSYWMVFSFHNSLFWTTSNSGFELFYTRLSGLWQVILTSEKLWECFLWFWINQRTAEVGWHLWRSPTSPLAQSWVTYKKVLRAVQSGFLYLQGWKDHCLSGNLINTLTVTNYRTWDC